MLKSSLIEDAGRELQSVRDSRAEFERAAGLLKHSQNKCLETKSGTEETTDENA